MKRLTQAFVGLLLACGVCVEAQAERRCNGALAQPPSVREVVVWVDENGKPVNMDTGHDLKPTLAPPENPALDIPPKKQPPISMPDTDGPRVASPPAVSEKNKELDDISAPAKDTQKENHLQAHPHPHPPPHPPPHHHPHPHPKPVHPNDQFGISYSPYKADRTCKNQEEVDSDLAKLSTYSFVRIYGTDCDQTKTVTTAARHHNMHVFAGIYDLTDFPASLDAFSKAITRPDGKRDWSIFHTIAIGNELVNAGTNSPSEVVNAVRTARSVLRSQGYKGPVVTVDTFSVLLDHPQLCEVSDYCAANCHAFFDATQRPGGAGAYALEQARSISAAAGGKRTVITESGWPHAGDANGVAVPSKRGQREAIGSLRRSFNHRRGDLVLFTAFDDLWKDDNAFTFGAEKFWGLHGGLLGDL